MAFQLSSSPGAYKAQNRIEEFVWLPHVTHDHVFNLARSCPIESSSGRESSIALYSAYAEAKTMSLAMHTYSNCKYLLVCPTYENYIIEHGSPVKSFVQFPSRDKNCNLSEF